jgi:hypothetical protein
MFRYKFDSCLRNIYAGSALIFVLKTACAAPVGFKDSWMTMGELGRDWKEASVMYSFTHRDAVGLGGSNIRWQPALGSQRNLKQTDLHYNRLLARWNTEHSQTNIFVLAGVAAAQGNFFSGTQTLFQPGLQFDHETRRIYTALKWHGYYSPALSASRLSVSGGFSLYATEYDEWQPWLILEVDRMGAGFRSQGANVEITPYVRFIHKTLFIEAGAPFKSGKSEGLKVNFRYTF